MKRAFVFLLLVIFCLFLAGCAISDTPLQKEVHTKTISGKILFRDPENDSDQGLVMLDPFTSKITPIGVFAENARFMGSTSKILMETGGGKIEVFDVETKESKQVYQSSDTASSVGYSITYVGEEKFSLVDQNKLILVNMQDGSKMEVTEGDGISVHSWSNSGKTVYYSTYTFNKDNQVSNQIFELNIETGEKRYLFDGICPKVSNDGNLIAYFPDTTRSKLVIKELKGKNQWEYRTPMVDFCFSPDGEFIASVEYWSGPWYYQGYTVKILDYKSGNAQTVVPQYSAGQFFDIDWTE